MEISVKNDVATLERLSSICAVLGIYVHVEYTDLNLKTWGKVTVKLHMNPEEPDEHFPFNNEMQASLVLMDAIDKRFSEIRSSLKEWLAGN